MVPSLSRHISEYVLMINNVVTALPLNLRGMDFFFLFENVTNIQAQAIYLDHPSFPV